MVRLLRPNLINAMVDKCQWCSRMRPVQQQRWIMQLFLVYIFGWPTMGWPSYRPCKFATTYVNSIEYRTYIDYSLAIQWKLLAIQCTNHSGGLNGILLLNNKINAASIQSTMQTMTGTKISPCMPTAPKINGKMPQASAPHANCRPISERPVDVSRVAIMIAVFNRTMIETGKMSAIDRMTKYDQYVTSMSPSICAKWPKTSFVNDFVQFYEILKHHLLTL